jgi:hypothetical protein
MKNKIAVLTSIAILVLGSGTWLYADYRFRSEIDGRLQAAVDSGSYEALSYEDLTFSFNGDVSLTNLLVQQPGAEYLLEKIHVSNLDYSHDIPRKMDVNIKGIRFPKGLPDLGSTENASLGLLLERIAENDAIPLEISYSHRYDPDNAWQLDSVVNIVIPSLMQLDVSSTMRNLPLESLPDYGDTGTDPAELQAQLMPLLNQTELPSFQFQLQDQGLVQAMIELGASDVDTPPEDYRKMLASQTRNAHLFLPQNAQELMMNAGLELAKFLEGGRTLTIKLQPEFNGSISKLQPQIMGAVLTGDINRVAQLLNLELTTQ